MLLQLFNRWTLWIWWITTPISEIKKVCNVKDLLCMCAMPSPLYAFELVFCCTSSLIIIHGRKSTIWIYKMWFLGYFTTLLYLWWLQANNYTHRNVCQHLPRPVQPQEAQDILKPAFYRLSKREMKMHIIL